MKKSSLKFFESLCNAPGPTGFEREPVRLTRNYVEPHCDEVTCDKLGSLIFRKVGNAKGPVILLPGHADEIGLLVSGIDEKTGFLTFVPLGGWPDQVLMAQRVRIMTRNGMVPGVIAAKPIHLMTAEERTKLVPKEKMFIDIGSSNPEEAAATGVRVGDGIVPDSTFSLIEKKVFKNKKESGTATLGMGRAFDNRAGLFVVAEAVRRLAEEKIKHPNIVVGAATTQEEVGLRGATTSGYKVNPDVCIALDVDLAGDVPGISKHEAPTSLGSGVSIVTYDRSLIPNQGLKELVIATAEAEKIPFTLSAVAGGEDAGAVHKGREGCPSICLGIPTRHIHSHVGILDLADVDHTVNLLIAIIKRLDAKTVASFTAI